MRNAITRRKNGLVTYGIAPPKSSYPADKRMSVAAKQIARISELPVDGLIIYDIQDESDRTSAERPFPYIETVDPVEYAFSDLGGLKVPKVVYRCVAPMNLQALRKSLATIEEYDGLAVFVGAASSHRPIKLSLPEAYALRRSEFPNLHLGGVMIAERHESRGQEELRVYKKQDAGCSFFISQAVYSTVTTKNLLSDLYYKALEVERELPPILITLTPCGSLKTLQFLRWLGISLPRWLENELTHAQNTLKLSVKICKSILEDIAEFADSKNIPLGCNIESVSLRKEEIDASVELVYEARRILNPSS